MVLYLFHDAREASIALSIQRDRRTRPSGRRRGRGRRPPHPRSRQHLRARPSLARSSERRCMNGFETLENRIAGAQPAEEPGLFADASAFFRTDREIVRCCEARAFADAAIRLHRTLLPANGYQLGETAARRGLASSWRPGDAHALPFEAATPALALLRATAHALAKQHEAEERARCTACGGRGWTIAHDGSRRRCSHALDAM